jgi:3-oxoacyl-[acyl-carrier-protein] synthase-3
MLSLNAFTTYVPHHTVPIRQLGCETGLSVSMLAIYELFYGLKNIAIYKEGGVISFIEKSLSILSADFSNVCYLIYLHTSDWVLPYGTSVLQVIQKKYGLLSVSAFELSHARCASYFAAFELLSLLLKPKESALVITGEIAFTPALRVVPNSTIVSDASTAAIWSHSDKQHCLLSVTTRFICGYEKGIYLSAAELHVFDLSFIENMAAIICAALKKAMVSLDQIQLILPHNVNVPTWQKIAKALSCPLEKIYMHNIPKMAHAFCSDHLINLQSAIEEGLLRQGDYYLMAGCGLGFTIAAAVFKF